MPRSSTPTAPATAAPKRPATRKPAAKVVPLTTKRTAAPKSKAATRTKPATRTTPAVKVVATVVPKPVTKTPAKATKAAPSKAAVKTAVKTAPSNTAVKTAPLKTVVKTAAPKAAPAGRVVLLPVEKVAEVVPLATATPRRRRGRAARPVVPVALGSLTQPGARTGETCDSCGTERVTSLALLLTDGTPVRFTSCHACEHRSWIGPDGALDRATVLERTRKLSQPGR